MHPLIFVHSTLCLPLSNSLVAPLERGFQPRLPEPRAVRADGRRRAVVQLFPVAAHRRHVRHLHVDFLLLRRLSHLHRAYLVNILFHHVYKLC